MSVPFHGQEFTFRQPDGTEIRLRGWGDQHNARFETLEGFPVVENPATGFYEYAAVNPEGEEVRPAGIRADVTPPSGAESITRLLGNRAAAKVRAQTSSGLPRGTTRWEQRRQQSRMALLEAMIPGIAPAPPKRKTVGAYVGLCILVQFPDVPGEIKQREVEEFCNQQGYTGYGNNGSVYDYFAENSLGKLQYTNVVTPYFTAKHPRSYYTDEKIKQPIRAWELITEALDHLRAGQFDFSRLTSDDEHYVYALNVFYAGPCVNRWAKGLWPHSYRLKDPYPLMAGKVAFDYQITNIGHELTLGTYCHENGHMICDFPDLYDYGGESEGLGIYCLMCAGGAVEAAIKNPTNICAYLKNAAGWTGSMTGITDGLTATAKAGVNQFFIYPKNETEYFVVENRYAEGRDRYLTDSGLAIYHVDHSGSNDNQAGTPSSHYECALMQADGESDLERGENIGDEKDLFNAEGITRFGDTTKPNSKWWDRKSSGLEIYDIGPAGREIAFSAKIR